MDIRHFWDRASDIFNLHHNKYRFTILTDREKRVTVTDFLLDMNALSLEWYSPDNETEDKQ